MLKIYIYKIINTKQKMFEVTPTQSHYSQHCSMTVSNTEFEKLCDCLLSFRINYSKSLLTTLSHDIF